MQGFRDIIRAAKLRRRTRRALAEIAGRKQSMPAPAPHGLPAPLVISLTSYPPRFATLADTLRSILLQSVRPDRVVLWIAEGDMAKLPVEVRELADRGLEIEPCEDLRSYKKIIPALQRFPDAYILTADDDVYYKRDWLEWLVKGAGETPGRIICRRAHRIGLNPEGLPLPYGDWDRNSASEVSDRLTFPTGVMGVMYPPGCFHADVARADLFRALAPSADDVWLYWMARLAGRTAQRVGPRERIVEWPGSQGENLRTTNLSGPGNDAAIAAMVQAYGFPT